MFQEQCRKEQRGLACLEKKAREEKAKEVRKPILFFWHRCGSTTIPQRPHGQAYVRLVYGAPGRFRADGRPNPGGLWRRRDATAVKAFCEWQRTSSAGY